MIHAPQVQQIYPWNVRTSFYWFSRRLFGVQVHLSLLSLDLRSFDLHFYLFHHRWIRCWCILDFCYPCRVHVGFSRRWSLTSPTLLVSEVQVPWIHRLTLSVNQWTNPFYPLQPIVSSLTRQSASDYLNTFSWTTNQVIVEKAEEIVSKENEDNHA